MQTLQCLASKGEFMPRPVFSGQLWETQVPWLLALGLRSQRYKMWKAPKNRGTLGGSAFGFPQSQKTDAHKHTGAQDVEGLKHLRV